MAIIIPYMNPIRFRKNTIDYVNRMPDFDNMTQRVDYQRGITAQKGYYPNFKQNQQLEIEYFTDDSPNIIITLKLPNDTFITLTPINITPAGWVSEDAFNLTYTPNMLGTYYIMIQDSSDTWTSDEFFVKPTTSNDLVELKYSDSQNRYGGFFTGNSNGGWAPKAYFTGIITEGEGETDQTFYTDQPGDPALLETTESDGLIVTLTDISIIDYKRIRWYRKCDNFYVNDVKVTCLEISKEDKSNNTDMCDVTLRCAYAENDGFYNSN